MHYVYILKNQQGKHYIGVTNNLESRLKQHNQNCVTSTKNRGPYKLVYKEVFVDKSVALKRENEIKKFKGNNVFRRLLETRFDPIV